MPENVFFEPMPVRMIKQDETEDDLDSSYMNTMQGFNQLKCSFGRFGDTDAVYVDENTMKCATPSIADDPADISIEEISLSVSMNGLTFPEEGSEGTVPFTFEGTAEPTGLLPIVLFIIALGCLIAAGIWYTQRYFESQAQNGGQ